MEPNILSVWIFRVAYPIVFGLLAYLLYRFFKQAQILRAERNQLIQQKNTIFSFIHDIGEMFSSSYSSNMNNMLDKSLFYAMRTCKARSGAVYLFSEDHKKLEAKAIAGIFPPLHIDHSSDLSAVISKSSRLEKAVRAHPFEIGEGVVGQATRGHAILSKHAELDDRIPNHEEDFLKIQTLLAVPMRFGNSIVGVVVLINRVDELPFTATNRNLLQSLADQSAVPVHYAEMNKTLEQKRQMDHDLDVAKQIQTLLLPHKLPELPQVELSAFNHPALAIGGDYYDVIQIDETHLGIVIADVSGKGIGGAMMMSVCRSMLRAVAYKYKSPAQTLSELNRMISPDMADDMFISMLYGVLDLKTRKIKWARAGHEAPILKRKGHNQVSDSPGIAIGLAGPEVFDEVIEDLDIQLEKGDLYVLYTDGITEAMDIQGEEWGIQNLMDTIANASGSPEEMQSNIRERVARFVGDREQYDDMTLMIMEIK